MWVSRDLHRDTVSNHAFRRVVTTGKRMQVVLMRLRPGESIGRERHVDTDQFFRIESGHGKIEWRRPNSSFWHSAALGPESAALVPAGTWHNIRATTNMRLYTIYAPPHHPPTTHQDVNPQPTHHRPQPHSRPNQRQGGLWDKVYFYPSWRKYPMSRLDGQ